MKGLVAVSLLTVVALSACADTADTPGNPPSEQATAPPTVEGEFVGCPGGPWVPISAFDTIEPVEGSDIAGLQEPLRDFLDSEEGVYWPQDDWHVLYADAGRVELVHDDSTRESSGAVSLITLTGRDGAWHWDGSSSKDSCSLQARPAPRLNEVDWELDPSTPEPSPDDTTIFLLATERECVSGRSMGHRLREPQVIATSESVRITLTATALPGDQNCLGNPRAKVEVTLPEPLGDRELVDGRLIGAQLIDYLD